MRPNPAASIALVAFAAVLADSAIAGEDDAGEVVSTLRALGPPLRAKISFQLNHDDALSGFTFGHEQASGAAPTTIDVDALEAQKLDGVADGDRWQVAARERLRRKEPGRARNCAMRALSAYYAVSKSQPSDALLVKIVSAADLIRRATPTDRDDEAAHRISAAAAADAAAGPRTWSWCGLLSAIRAVELATGKPRDASWGMDDCLQGLTRAGGGPPAAVQGLDEAERLVQRAVEATDAPGTDPSARADALSRRYFVRMLCSAQRAGAGKSAESDEKFRGAIDDVVALAAAAPDVPEAIVAGAFFPAMGKGTTGAPPEEIEADVLVRAKAAIDQLALLGQAKDRSVRSRAWHGTALLQFLVLRDRDAARSSALRAVEADPAAERSWILGAGLLRQAERYEELCAWCSRWTAATGSPLCRETWAHAEWLRDESAAAERLWRSLLGTGLGDLRARLGVANCLLARGGDAALDEAETMLGTAREKHPDAISGDRDTWSCWMEHSAVLSFRRGQRDTAESAARRILEAFPESETAKAVLKALGK